MTTKDIDKALDFRLSEYLTAYPIAVDYPTISYTPVLGTPYLKIDYLHGDSNAVELGSESDDRNVGIYQITINVENNKGSAQSTALITQLKEYFKRGTIATYNGLNVRITAFNTGDYDSNSDWYREVVNITFRSDISN